MTTAGQSVITIENKPSQDSGISIFAPELEKIFALRPTERSYHISTIRGTVPAYIIGSYYINGPALFSRSGLRYRHWLDGDGMVCSLRFAKDGVRFTNRFVRTTKFTAEEEAGRPLFRTFGTAFSGDLLKRGITLESPGNVSVYPYSGTLLAFGEQALPWQLEPETLETIGQFNFRGSLTELSPFAAHPKFDPETGEMFNFGIFFSNKAPKLCIYWFNKDGHLKRRTSATMEHACAVHDFSLTSNYLVFYISPYLLDIDHVVRGGYSVMESLNWQPELGSHLLIFSRHTGEQVASITMNGRYCLHLINSSDLGNKLMVDVIELDRPVYDQYQPLPDLFSEMPAGGPVRLSIDLTKRGLISRNELDYQLSPDFPAIDPRHSARPYSDFWMLGLSKAGRYGRKFFDQLVHLRWDEPKRVDIFQAAPRRYLGGEPIFIGDPKSEDGTVICQEFDADHTCSAFLLFNAFDVAAGPVATLELEELIPLAFHASFLPKG